MHGFHYKQIKRKFSAYLLFKYTDILVYEIKKNNDYEGFYENKILLEFRDYPKDSKFFILLVRK